MPHNDNNSEEMENREIGGDEGERMSRYLEQVWSRVSKRGQGDVRLIFNNIMKKRI